MQKLKIFSQNFSLSSNFYLRGNTGQHVSVWRHTLIQRSKLNYIASHKKLLSYRVGQCLIQGFLNLNWFLSVDHYAYSDIFVDPKKGDRFPLQKTHDWCVKEWKKRIFTSEKSTTNQIEGLHCKITHKLTIKIHAWAKKIIQKLHQIQVTGTGPH